MTIDDTDFGLEYPFTEEELKRARRTLLAKYHPDRAPDTLKSKYTLITQKINADYARMHPSCVSTAKKTISVLNKKHSIYEIVYGVFMLIEIPAYILFGIILNSMLVDTHWLYLLCGTSLLLATFFFYIAKMKISVRLQLLQILSFAYLFAIPYPLIIFSVAFILTISLWIYPKLSFFAKR